MGIKDLLPALVNSTQPITIEEMVGTVVAIDASSWLHRGIYSCAKELFLGQKTDSYIKFFMDRIELLLRNRITPLVVFDGPSPLPAKAQVAAERREKRTIAKQLAWISLRQGDENRARQHCCSAAEITPDMVNNIIKALKDKGVDFVVAPYEADPQLALMSLSRTADYIITEDTNLLVYGAKQVIYNWEGDRGQLICQHLLYRSFPDLPDFTFQKFQYICILAGCDYLKSLPNMGIEGAKNFVKALGDRDIFMQVKNIGLFVGGHITVPPEYPDNFKMALNTFTYQTVYNPDKGYTPLHEYPPGLSAADFTYAGLPLPDAPVADLSRTWVSEDVLNKTDQTDFTFKGTSSSDDESTESTHSTPYNLRSQQQKPISTVLSIGEDLKWTPPSFPVMTIDFITGTLSSEHSQTHTQCLFEASDRRVLLYTPPFDIIIQRSCTITAQNTSYLVVWEWGFHEPPINFEAHRNDTESEDESDMFELDSDSEDDDRDHVLPFEVMGVAHSRRRQEVLEWAHDEMVERNSTPQVELIPERINPLDEIAIAVCINTARGPETVGYIAKEMTQYVHPIINTNRLTCARIGRIAFRTTYENYGWFMKLLITRKGTWDRAVIRQSRHIM
ncbi:PREDICTED: exonuclease 1-like isoform X2 [Branchiostoma belcheri]|uniref:Exonuclease 1 n=1 Tax=Branchiostoma belcheri TaxID=7741 RepID=A0A6P4ZJ77_BRABE|nr:PREDICTED: exonuclease 1-like isoform X2 [Branchiostoma belcheri]